MPRDLGLQRSPTIFLGSFLGSLLVLLTASSKDLSNIFLLKPGKKGAVPKFYNRTGIKVEAAADSILFLHAYSGCDTTSAIYNHTKSKFISVFKNQPDFAKKCAAVFQNPESQREEITAAGNKFLLTLYGCKNPEETSLNNFRYKCFVKTAFQTKQNLASLPPSEEAAQNLSFRTFQQVQAWKEGCGTRSDGVGLAANKERLVAYHRTKACTGRAAKKNFV